MEIVCEGYKKSMRKDSDNAKLLEPGELPSKRKVLVVEDNELNRDILSSFLEEKFDVFLAENGEEGLELLSEHYRELSVVLLDICMPVCVMDLNSLDAETQINFCQPYRLSL